MIRNIHQSSHTSLGNNYEHWPPFYTSLWHYQASVIERCIINALFNAISQIIIIFINVSHAHTYAEKSTFTLWNYVSRCNLSAFEMWAYDWWLYLHFHLSNIAIENSNSKLHCCMSILHCRHSISFWKLSVFDTCHNIRRTLFENSSLYLVSNCMIYVSNEFKRTFSLNMIFIRYDYY